MNDDVRLGLDRPPAAQPPPRADADHATSRVARGSTHHEQRPGELRPEEIEEVRKLAQRDREVRAHEQAHKIAGGAYAGAIHYEHQTGPDNRRYAVSGHVSIDISEVAGDPRATVQKMQQVYRAALAPQNPSAQDRAVAAQAKQKERAAQAELNAESRGQSQAVVVAARRVESAYGPPSPAGQVLSLTA